MRIITKADIGKEIEVQLHELFAVEVEAIHANNEYLAVPSFIQKQNFEIIKEYSYHSPVESNVQEMGKRIFLLMATRVSEIDLSWYNLSTAKEVLQFLLKVKAEEHYEGIAHHVSDNNEGGLPNAVGRSNSND